MANMKFIKYKNLSTEMKNKHISAKQLAAGLGIPKNILKDKLSRRKTFDLEEVRYINRIFFPEYDTSYLFKESYPKESCLKN